MYAVTSYTLKAFEADPLMVPTPNLVDRRNEDTKRRLEQEIDRKMLAILNERRTELTRQWEEYLVRPNKYEWPDEPLRMYYPGRYWY
jgi:hypothetical protein